MILFDTRDADITGFGGGTTPEGQALQVIADGLDIPPLEPIPGDHVLTRTFYLLQDFPGRHQGGQLWVEASPDAAAEAAEGMPFRNLNDGVTPVVIGGADWASAWATDDGGVPLVQVGRGFAGRTTARDRLPLRHQPHHACADRQLQIRPGPCACPSGKAWANDRFGERLGRLRAADRLAASADRCRASWRSCWSALALWRGLSGWWLRALALGALLLALANPALQEEERQNLTDIVIAVVDDSASQGLADRRAQTEAALAVRPGRESPRMPNTELRIHRVGDGDEDAGSLVMTALAEALAEEPRARVAGAILITDGRVHDAGRRSRTCPRRFMCF